MTAPVFWWRDDDAGRDAPALARLLELAEARRCPVALAVVPAWLEPAATRRILGCPFATVLQHGIAHENHSAEGEKRRELGGKADRSRLVDAMVDGRGRLADRFGPQFLPVMVPPWNRIDADVAERLPDAGFVGLSCFGGPRQAAAMVRLDTHLDAVAWRDGRRPRPWAVLQERLETGSREGPWPFGLLTHHLVVDAAGWGTLDRALGYGQTVADARWAGAHELFEGST
ncbi:MAG: polysaccharide deacetylase [Pseudomonadota bacterium]